MRTHYFSVKHFLIVFNQKNTFFGTVSIMRADSIIIWSGSNIFRVDSSNKYLIKKGF